MSMTEQQQIYLSLIIFAESIGLRVIEINFKHLSGLIKGNRIGIRVNDSLDEKIKSLAHEIAHFYLLKDEPRNLIEYPDAVQEENADRMAEGLIAFSRYAVTHFKGLPNILDECSPVGWRSH